MKTRRNAKIDAGKNRPTSSVGVLRCYAAVFTGAGFFAWTRGVATGYIADSAGVGAICVRCVFRKSPTSRHDYQSGCRASLAVNVPVKAIWADPKEVHTTRRHGVGVAGKALSALNIPANKLSARIAPARGFTFIWRAGRNTAWRTTSKTQTAGHSFYA